MTPEVEQDDPTESKMVDWLLERHSRASAWRRWRRARPYDGLLGKLPAWVPQWHRDDFTRTRDRLLDELMHGERVMPQQVLDWIDAYAAAGEGGDARWPDERGEEIGRLAHYRYAVSLGEDRGLVLLAGDDAVRGREVAAGQVKARASREANTIDRAREAQKLAAAFEIEGEAPAKVNGLVGKALGVTGKQASNLRKKKLPDGNSGP